MLNRHTGHVLIFLPSLPERRDMIGNPLSYFEKVLEGLIILYFTSMFWKWINIAIKIVAVLVLAAVAFILYVSLKAHGNF